MKTVEAWVKLQVSPEAITDPTHSWTCHCSWGWQVTLDTAGVLWQTSGLWRAPALDYAKRNQGVGQLNVLRVEHLHPHLPGAIHLVVSPQEVIVANVQFNEVLLTEAVSLRTWSGQHYGHIMCFIVAVEVGEIQIWVLGQHSSGWNADPLWAKEWPVWGPASLWVDTCGEEQSFDLTIDDGCWVAVVVLHVRCHDIVVALTLLEVGEGFVPVEDVTTLESFSSPSLYMSYCHVVQRLQFQWREHCNSKKINVSSYIACIQSKGLLIGFTFYSLADLFNWRPSQLLWETYSHAAINAPRWLIEISTTA